MSVSETKQILLVLVAIVEMNDDDVDLVFASNFPPLALPRRCYATYQVNSSQRRTLVRSPRRKRVTEVGALGVETGRVGGH